MTDYSELKRLAEAAIEYAKENDERWPQDDDWFEPELFGVIMDYTKSVSPSAVLALIAEIEELREEVQISDRIIADRDRLLSMFECPDHGQCVPHAMAQVETLRKDAERYRWLRQYTVKSLPVFGALERLDRDIDAAMTQGAKP